LSKFLAGTLYDAHLDESAADPFTSIGAGCFRETHSTVTGLTLTGVGTGATLEYFSY